MLSRHIDFEGMSNVRDLGGMTGADGKKIKSGLLFRSDQLHSATKADQEKLKEIGVKYIVDLRNIREYTEQPDPRIDGITPVCYYSWQVRAEKSEDFHLLEIEHL